VALAKETRHKPLLVRLLHACANHIVTGHAFLHHRSCPSTFPTHAALKEAIDPLKRYALGPSQHWRWPPRCRSSDASGRHKVDRLPGQNLSRPHNWDGYRYRRPAERRYQAQHGTPVAPRRAVKNDAEHDGL